MLAVCIPIRDIRVGNLILDLHQQTRGLDIPILLIDDASVDEAIKAENQATAIQYGALYYENPVHLGTGATRNRFASLTDKPFLLYIDAGKQVIRSNYIQTYLEAIEQDPADAYCGGLKGPKPCPSKDHHLRYAYGKKYEERDVAYRKKRGARLLCSCNLLIRKEVILTIGFNPRRVLYGHDDTQLGIEMSRAHYRFRAIDNPIGKQLDTNQVFLRKTHEAITQLQSLLSEMNAHSWIQELPIIQFWMKLKRYHLVGVYRWCFKIFRPWLRWGLVHGHLGCLSLQAYKVGLLVSSDTTPSF